MILPTDAPSLLTKRLPSLREGVRARRSPRIKVLDGTAVLTNANPVNAGDFLWGKWPDWPLITAADHWWPFRGYGGNNGEDYRPIELFERMKGEQTWTINILAKRCTPRPPMKELYRAARRITALRLRADQAPLFM